MSFQEDLKFEEDFYYNIFRPWLDSQGTGSIFIHFNSGHIVYEALQKKDDIDVILDNRKENISLSLKTVRKKYDRIFFETISNTNTGSQGWGYYSKADFIVYSMKADNSFTAYCFKLLDIHILSLDQYQIAYGKTYDKSGNMLYKTEGRLIPLSDFKHTTLF